MINRFLVQVKINKIMCQIKELNNIKEKINIIKNEIDSQWRSDEVRYINYAFDMVNNEILEATKMMNNLNHDIKKQWDK